MQSWFERRSKPQIAIISVIVTVVVVALGYLSMGVDGKYAQSALQPLNKALFPNSAECYDYCIYRAKGSPANCASACKDF